MPMETQNENQKPSKRMLAFAEGLSRRLDELTPWFGWEQNSHYEISTGDFSGEHAPFPPGRSTPPTFKEVYDYIVHATKRLGIYNEEAEYIRTFCETCKLTVS